MNDPDDENELCTDEAEPDDPDNMWDLSDFPPVETPVGELNRYDFF